VLPTPSIYKFALGSGEGKDSLTAFDRALLQAGIGNVNLLRITSILPPSAGEDEKLSPPYGALVPAAFGTFSSERPGETISAAVGIGFSRDTYGVIMEAAGPHTRAETEDKVERMLQEAFANRGLDLRETLIRGIEHQVIRVGSVFAAVVLWYPSS